MRDHAIPILALILTIPSACDSDSSPQGRGYARRDSAGVTFVTNDEPNRSLSLREVMRVGVVEGDPLYEFENVRAITVDSAGGFWVVDRAEAARHYDRNGQFVGAVGGRGDGPGESDMYYSVTLNGREVLLFGTPGVLQLFDGDGTLLKDIRPDLGRPFTGPIGAAGGQWLLYQRHYPDDARQVFRSEMTFLRAGELDGPRDTIQRFAGELARVVGGEGEHRGIGRASWFHGDPAFGVDRQGRIFVSDTLRYRVASYDLDGRLIRVLERSAEPREFDPAWLTEMESGFAAAQLQLAPRGRAVDRAGVDRQMASAAPDPVPAHLFFIEDILVGPQGELWIERADRHPRPGMRAVAHQFGYIRHAWLPGWAAPRIFDVLDSEGRYLGTVELPEDFAPMAVADRRVYGIHYDELDVERVVVYEIGAEGDGDGAT